VIDAKYQSISIFNKMKNKKYHTVGAVPKSNRKIAETEAKWRDTRPITFLAWYRHFNKQLQD
jgi:hypothetical protein